MDRDVLPFSFVKVARQIKALVNQTQPQLKVSWHPLLLVVQTDFVTSRDTVENETLNQDWKVESLRGMAAEVFALPTASLRVVGHPEAA